MTAPPLVTQRHLEDVMRRLLALEKRVGRGEVRERLLTDSSTYTPTYTGGTTPGTTTYTLQSGAWVRLGALLIVTLDVAWSAATGTGAAQFSLPTTSTGTAYAGSADLLGVTFANSTPVIELIGGNSFFTLRSPLTNANGAVVQMEAAGQCIATLAYFV